MIKHVLLRRKMLHGNITQLVRATVLSEARGRMRVSMDGKVFEVAASDTVSVASVSGGQPVARQTRELVVPKMYPDSGHALANRLNR